MNLTLRASTDVRLTDLRNTLGHHIEVVGIFSIEPFLKAFYSAQLLYVVDIAIIKISILLFYWRLFAVSSRRPIILMMTILGVWAISLVSLTAPLSSFPSPPTSLVALTDSLQRYWSWSFNVALSLPTGIALS